VQERHLLYLTRKIGESIVINDDIEVTVVAIRGKSVKLGFTFPEGASVLRRELYERIQDEKAQASAAGIPVDSVRLPGHQEAAHDEHRSNDAQLDGDGSSDDEDHAEDAARKVSAARSVR
jgi:carbon storage regulator